LSSSASASAPFHSI